MIIGITGSFGTGKTTVSQMFRKLGAEVIDADEIVHRLLKPDTKVYRKVTSVFGKNINRRALAEIVFNHKSSLKKLCNIVHPIVIKEIKHRIKNVKSNKVVVIDAPLLIEAGVNAIVDKLVVVKTYRSIQIERIKKHIGLTKSQIEKRLQFQMPLKEKIKLADFVIDNNGRQSQTEKQVKKIWQELKPSCG